MEKLNFEKLDYTVFEKYVTSTDLLNYVYDQTKDAMINFYTKLENEPKYQDWSFIDVITNGKDCDNLGLEFVKNGSIIHNYFLFLSLLKKGGIEPSTRMEDKMIKEYDGFSNFYMALLEYSKQVDNAWLVVYINDEDVPSFHTTKEDCVEYYEVGKPVLLLNFEDQFLSFLGVDKLSYLESVWENLNWQAIEKSLDCQVCGCRGSVSCAN